MNNEQTETAEESAEPIAPEQDTPGALPFDTLYPELQQGGVNVRLRRLAAFVDSHPGQSVHFGLNEQEIEALGAVFAAEVNTAIVDTVHIPELSKFPSPCIDFLCVLGLIEPVQVDIPAPLSRRLNIPKVVSTYCLTQYGHMAYCMICPEPEPDEIETPGNKTETEYITVTVADD